MQENSRARASAAHGSAFERLAVLPPPKPDITRRTSTLSLLGGFLFFFAPQLLSKGVPFRRDALLLHLPIRQFLHESLRSGALPQWYPYEGLGVPFIGQIVTATFHPQTLLFLPFPAPLALKLNTLAAYLLGAAGGYRFARRFSSSRLGALTGAASLAFGGYALSMSDNLPYLVGLMTLPWVGWAAAGVVQKQRARDVGVLGLAWALLFLGGDAQSFAVTPLLLIAVALAFRATLRTSLLLAGAGLLATLLCCIELLPALAVYADSARFAGQSTIDFGTYWALHPARVAEFIIPGFLPAAQRMEIGQALFGQPFTWAVSLFAGGLTVLFATLALVRKSRPVLVMAGFTLLTAWLALGSRGGAHFIVTHLVPMLGRFRYPEKYLAFCWVGLIPLVASGWDVFRDNPQRWARVAIGAGLAVGLATVVVPGIEALTKLHLPWRTGLLTTAAFLALAGLLSFSGRMISWVPVLLVLELWNGNALHFPLVSSELLEESANPVAAAVKEDASRGLAPPRIVNVSSPSPIRADTTDAFEAWTASSMALLRPDAAGLADVSVMGHSALPAFGGRARLLFGPNGARDEQFSSLLGACFRTTGVRPLLHPGDSVVLELPEAKVSLIRQLCRPRAYLGAVRPAEDADAAFAWVNAGLLGREAIWERGPVRAGDGAVQWLAWRPGEVRLLAEATAEAGLVLSEAYGPGWCAEVDGAPAELLPTNVIAMGVPLEKGRHTVTFRYATPRLLLGAVLTGIGLLLVLALVSRGRRGRSASEIA